jgi:glucosamine kinase
MRYKADEFLLGVDGGGTQCRARLADRAGTILGQGVAGPANVRLGLETSLAAVLGAARQCIAEAGFGEAAWARTTACLALAGATEPRELAAAQAHPLPFRHSMITTDAHAACAGAHRERDGGVVIVGTGSIGWAIVDGRQYRVGGWGLPLGDEGSGAWLGREAMRRVLRAYDGRAVWTPLLTRLFEAFDADPHAIVRWAATARPGDFGALAPIVVEHAAPDDAAATLLIHEAAQHIAALATRLVGLGADRLALSGGLARALEPWLPPEMRADLVPPAGDALSGALQLAQAEAAARAAEA